MGVCNCSMFCCTLLYVHSSIAIILMGKRELIALLNLSSWCLVMLSGSSSRCCLQFVIVVFPDHTHFLFFKVNHVYYSIENGYQLVRDVTQMIMLYGFKSMSFLQGIDTYNI